MADAPATPPHAPPTGSLASLRIDRSASGYVVAQRRPAVASSALGTQQAVIATAQAAIAQSQAQVRMQQVNQANTEIRAPFDGVVLVKNANVGDMITPFSSASGTSGAVVTMADMATLEVEAVPVTRGRKIGDVQELTGAALKSGERVVLSPGETLKAGALVVVGQQVSADR